MFKRRFDAPWDRESWIIMDCRCFLTTHLPFVLWPVGVMKPLLLYPRVFCSIISIFLMFREIVARRWLQTLLWNIAILSCFVGLPMAVLFEGGLRPGWLFHGYVCLVFTGIIASFTGSCELQRIGQTEVLWQSGKEFPIKGEDFAYLLWRKRDCCLL